MASTDEKNFALALITWMRADSTLSTAVGADSRMLIGTGQDEVARPALFVQIFDTPMLSDIDVLHLSTVRCVAKGAARTTVVDIIGALRELASQNTTTLKDAAFSDANVKTLGIKPVGGTSPQGEVVDEPNDIEADINLEIRWRAA